MDRWHRRRFATEKGDRVSFLTSDVFLPDLDELCAPWNHEAEVEGTVIDFSDSGEASRVFAVVEVLQKQTVVVPIAKLNYRGNST